MDLLQDKLDVLKKKRSNIFNWRGQFTPEFVEYMLHNFSEQGYFILDPFSGSGTVLQESARNHLKATGVEINPAAYAMSKFFTFCNFDYSQKISIYSEFEKKVNNYLSTLNGQMIFQDNSDYRLAYAHLLDCANKLNKMLANKQERILLLNLLFQSEKDKSMNVKDSISKSLLYIKNTLLKLNYSEEPINALLDDSRNVGNEFNEKVDLILTSPPYINVFNYHQNFRAIVEAFQFDLLKVAHSEFGANRKHRSNRFKTVIQYSLDMELAIRSFWKSLKPNGTMILVLGRESNVRSTPFYNGQIVIEILNASGGFINTQILERKFINKFGNDIKEDIIIAKKVNNLSKSFYGREIALKHLEKSLKTTQNGVQTDIQDAINTIKEVMPSPVFNSKNIIKNEQYTA
ncbi:MAG: site-specific DNA-methyltransferase [Bacteroidales bacterium]|jgi:DNA modification methylase|nr:site-specific DNA-methyltransferase [Bacteroidales bacterium]